LTHSPPPFRRRNIFVRLESRPASLNMSPLTQGDIRRLFALLNEELRNSAIEGELFPGWGRGHVSRVRPHAHPHKTFDAVFPPFSRGNVKAAARVAAAARA